MSNSSNSLEKLWTSFSVDNAVFSGGFGLALLAGSAQLARGLSSHALRLLKRHLLVTLEVTSKDRAYPWVLQWLSLQGKARTQHLSVETSFRHSQSPSVSPSLSSSPSASVSHSHSPSMHFDLVPGPGQHFLSYGGRLMLVQRVREQTMVDLNTGKPWEKVLFTSYGRSTTVFNDLLQEAYGLSVLKEEGKTIIFTNWGSEWRQFGQARRRRTLDSVILDDGVSRHLLNDVEEWITSSKWYSDRGIPYRRGYLLYGPPGSGKSSFIFALAGKLGYNICILNLAERGLTDDRLALALSSIPPQSIVLLEDIDAAFPNREEKFDQGSNLQHASDVTFSGLLNVLDGVAASEERLIFMTTNHIDRLDPALIRPGRVDYAQLVGDATDYQVQELFTRFYPTADGKLSEEFLQKLRVATPKISMAGLQGYFLRNKDNASNAIENVAQIMENLDSHRHTISAGPIPVKHNHRGPVKPRPVRPLTVEQVDKMYFNPQPGWDQNL